MLCLDCNPTMADGAVSADSRAQSTVSLTWFPPVPFVPILPQ